MTGGRSTKQIAELLLNPETTYDVEESEVIQIAQAYLDLRAELERLRPRHDYSGMGF